MHLAAQVIILHVHEACVYQVYDSTHIHITICIRIYTQVMSESVACALEVLDCDQTRQTRVFIRMINRFFDCLNVKTHKTGLMKRNDALLP